MAWTPPGPPLGASCGAASHRGELPWPSRSDSISPSVSSRCTRIDHATGEIERVKLRRAEVLSFFANRPQCVVAMEACGSSHHWARQLRTLGHEVRLIATKFVRPFVK